MRSLSTMQSVSDILDKMDGASAVAKILHLPTTTVASWKSRNSIPVDHWTGLVEAARERGLDGLTYEQLVTIHTDQRVAS